jgi:hypothetical protein
MMFQMNIIVLNLLALNLLVLYFLCYKKEGFSYTSGVLEGYNNMVLTDTNGNLGSIQFPKGMIMIWTEGLNNIPEGWALCDGTRGTPNLMGKFLLGVTPTGDIPSVFRTLKASGGSAKISVGQLPAHTHNVGFQATGLEPGRAGGMVDSVGTWNPTKPVVSKPTGAGEDYYPPFVTVAYIMKI